jgi:hypothetical protein
MRGFTLVEGLVSLGVFFIIMGGVYAVLNAGSWVFFEDSQRIDLQQQVRLGVDGMSRELRQSNRSSLVLVGSDDLTFSVRNYTVRYFLDDNQIKRENPADVVRPIALNVTGMTISCRDANNNVTSCGSAQTVLIQVLASKPHRAGGTVYFPSQGGMTINETVRFRN